jgi:hypothetical protein
VGAALRAAGACSALRTLPALAPWTILTTALVALECSLRHGSVARCEMTVWGAVWQVSVPGRGSICRSEDGPSQQILETAAQQLLDSPGGFHLGSRRRNRGLQIQDLRLRPIWADPGANQQTLRAALHLRRGIHISALARSWHTITSYSGNRASVSGPHPTKPGGPSCAVGIKHYQIS